MALEFDKLYYIKNVATGKYLNVYGNDTVENERNVNVYTKEDVLAQKWIVRLAGNGAQVHTAINEAYALNIYTVNNNCSMYKVAENSLADSVVDFVTVDASQNLYRIQMMAHSLYLTVNTSTDNAYFGTDNESFYALWQLEEVDGENNSSSSSDTININLRDKISSYNQRTDSKYIQACAGICGCMAINMHPDSVPYSYVYPADWYPLASLVGKTASITNSTSLSNVLSQLQSGYPVIVRTRTSDTSAYGDHWVIVYGYSGSATNVVDSGFLCIDPWGNNETDTFGKECKLSESSHFYGISRQVYFY